MIVISARYVGGYSLDVLFDDNTVKRIDFYDYMCKSENPLIRQFLDTGKFRDFAIVDGVLTWYNDMDFDPDSLYEENINGLQYISSNNYGY